MINPGHKSREPKMIKYELIPHTADIRLKISGATQEELFTASLQGMSSILKKDVQIDKLTESKEIKIKSCDMTSLLIDFLSEVLTASQIQKTVFYKIKFLKLGENELHAIISGTKVNAFCEDIKAVTYHEADVHKNVSGDLETAIVFDI